jgi:hypothetical protein
MVPLGEYPSGKKGHVRRALFAERREIVTQAGFKHSAADEKGGWRGPVHVSGQPD